MGLVWWDVDFAPTLRALLQGTWPPAARAHMRRASGLRLSTWAFAPAVFSCDKTQLRGLRLSTLSCSLRAWRGPWLMAVFRGGVTLSAARQADWACWSFLTILHAPMNAAPAARQPVANCHGDS